MAMRGWPQLLLILIILYIAVTVNSDQYYDNDLVFDDIGEQSKPAIIQNAFREQHNSIVSSSLSTSELRDNNNEDGIIHHLGRFTRRIKRGLLDWVGITTKEKTSAEIEQVNDLLTTTSTLSSSSLEKNTNEVEVLEDKPHKHHKKAHSKKHHKNHKKLETKNDGISNNTEDKNEVLIDSEERLRRSTIIPEASTNQLGQVAAALRRSDDEDDVGASGDFDETGGNNGLYLGSGQTELPPDDNEQDSGEQKMRSYRVTFTLQEVYHDDFKNRRSDIFRQLADNLTRAVDSIFDDLNLKSNVIKIEHTDDVFKSKVTIDLKVLGNLKDGRNVQERLLHHIRRRRNLGPLIVSDENFTFRENQGSDSSSSSECDVNQLPCRSGECLPSEARCNGVSECRDGSDEAGCPPAVTTSSSSSSSNIHVDKDQIHHVLVHNGEASGQVFPGGPPLPPKETSSGCRGDDQFRCPGSTHLICLVQLCDGTINCPDGADEANCTNECSSTEFACDNQRCIAMSQRCNGIRDCSDGTDEHDCPNGVGPCPSDSWHCPQSGECLSQTVRCNNVLDCYDGSDEQDCHSPRPPPHDNICPNGQFLCIYEQRCINMQHRCDGIPDCYFGYRVDERDCPCNEFEWQCDNGVCLPRDLKCNGVVDCPQDNSDERRCFTSCENMFLCQDGIQCIPTNQRCNRIPNCNDASDEKNCPCKPGQFFCASSDYCIDSHLVCNGINNCNDMSDEINCTGSHPNICGPQGFQCYDGSCIRKELRCNRQADCSDGSDEDNCPGIPSCKRDEFRCHDGTCLSINSRCNGYAECRNGEDEQNCQKICSVNEFRCQRDGRCIDNQLRCNGYPDCSDRSDEENCRETDRTTAQPSFEHCNGFRCKIGTCISSDLVCDSEIDCLDGSDEENCSGGGCAANEFRCHDEKTCIRDIQRCDSIVDCLDGSDENDCPGVCGLDEWTCQDGTCIAANQRCDIIEDCRDGTDEQNCEGCAPDQYQCADGTCIAAERECNGYNECRDGSDELNCPDIAPKCAQDEFECDQGVCLPNSRRCDGVPDCQDRMDEFDCRTHDIPHTCGPHDFTCQDGSCIDRRARCNGARDCRDGSDERGCGCPSGEFDCGDGVTCIPQHARCDGKYNCPNSQDEIGCAFPPTTESPFPRCPRGQRACRDGSQCLDERAFCNGRVDCNDFSDEENCQMMPNEECPRPGEFRCENGPCINRRLRCNDKVDCPRDNSDELDCPNSAAGRDGLNLKTYPNEQIIKENREVVFQCRDEGPTRARVVWSRADGKPLPPGSRDLSGRLEMPDIQLEHSGTYYCDAVGYPTSAPGARVAVHLEVEPYSAPQPLRPPKACGLNEATCSNEECIPKSRVCDGRFDCTDGSDELRCNPHGCEPNEFRCANKKCVLKTWVCDGDNDCIDGTDEENCATNPPGSPCKYHEFQCSSQFQCIPRSFHCDHQNDCIDGSDEVGCSPVYIQRPPPPMIVLDLGDTLNISCTAVGVPTPEVVWRHNWRHVPDNCQYVSHNGLGVLTCENVQEAHQGAYSCEAINTQGAKFAVPDTILVITGSEPQDVCPVGYFNAHARTPSECISCFCFGVTTKCRSADLFTHQLQPPFELYKIVGVNSRNLEVTPTPYVGTSQSVQPIGTNGAHIIVTRGRRINPEVYPYFALPESYMGNRLKSYGGNIRYGVLTDDQGASTKLPDIILIGNGYTLYHKTKTPVNFGLASNITSRFFYGEWYKANSGRNEYDNRYDDHESFESGDQLASREELMMVLMHVENILIRAQYVDGSDVDTKIQDITMDTAVVQDMGQGESVYVEECQCPAGYTGNSCEYCLPGYSRHKTGPWLGMCSREPETCPIGEYGDPSRGIACRACPCPLTTPPNQFARSCHLDFDGQPTCDCPIGYYGRRCEQCSIGYRGNPLIPGDYCRPSSSCNSVGTASENNGQCYCKDYVTGPLCDRCKSDSFHLSNENEDGCISCFCMGVTETCSSSKWYRQQLSSTFTRDTLGFALVESQRPTEPIQSGLRVENRELVFSDFGRGQQEPYYWLLPPQYLGNKITSYGGTLNYTIRHQPAPGGQSSRNSAPDVELISGNELRLMHFSREQLMPDRVQSIAVPLLEQYWQRHDGQPANREHLLMALADLSAILIKASYTTNTRQTNLVSLTLDIAEERNTGQPRAFTVEQCNCPPGYTGLSCEECSAGYTRGEGGLYLGICEPCHCNGHSSHCDPRTGECFNCLHGTSGARCDQCADGYSGQPTSPEGCHPQYGSGSSEVIEPSDNCRCDPAGTEPYGQCYNDQCQCKTNTEGRECNRCRPGTFGLSFNNPAGCSQCYCSGLTDNCQSSQLYRTQIPMQIIDQHNSANRFTLRDIHTNAEISDGFNLNIAMNEIGYKFGPHDSSRLYWSLPPQFTGNKILSYGGNLTINIRYENDHGAVPSYDKDVILNGNGLSLSWTHEQNEDIQTFTIPLLESEWHREIPYRTASRSDMLLVLSNLDSILVRARQTGDFTTRASYLSDVTLDTAVSQRTGQGSATDVEQCRCPIGYKGYSCESCANGYYRDRRRDIDGSSPLGSCVKCPCNGNEEECSLGRNGQVSCTCREGWTGTYCDSEDIITPLPPPRESTPFQPTISITISEPSIQIVEAGSTVRYHCNGRSLIQRPIKLNWYKEGGELPRDRASDNRQGLLVITNLRPEDSGIYVCTADDGLNVITERATLNVGGSPPEHPRVTIYPSSRVVDEGEPVEFRCESSGSPMPELRWVHANNRELNPNHSFRDGVYRIPAVRKADEGQYLCYASNSAGTDSSQTQLYVREPTIRPTQPPRPPAIQPPYYHGSAGDTVRLHCLTYDNRQQVVRWTRQGGLQMPTDHEQQNGVLTIRQVQPSDSGVYVCVIPATYGGREDRVETRVSITTRIHPPSVSIQPNRLTINQRQGGSLKCIVSGDPRARVRWEKVGDSLGPNMEQIGSDLRIENAQVKDRGVYVCFVDSPAGKGQASAILEVTRQEPPRVIIHPPGDHELKSGDSLLLQCRVEQGIPTPRISWHRQDGTPLSPRIEDIGQGMLRFNRVTRDDAGVYECRAINSVGQITESMNILVRTPPRITLRPNNNLQSVVGDRIKFECLATGDPDPTVTWSKYGHGHGPSNTLTTNQQYLKATVEINGVRKEDEGSYTCVATNAAGTAEERLHLVVEESNEVGYDRRPGRGDIPGTDEYPYPDHSEYQPELRPQHRPEYRPEIKPDYRNPDRDHERERVFTVNAGGKATIRCTSHDAPEVYTEFRREDQRQLPSRYMIDNGNLILDTVEESDSGVYLCIGINKNTGSTEFIVRSRLVVQVPPRVQLDPSRQVVRPGDDAQIICSASGDQPIVIQWRAVNRPLPPGVMANGGLLRFRGIRLSDQGRYVCVARNSAGEGEGSAEVIVGDSHVTDVGIPRNHHVNALEGSNVVLNCHVPHTDYYSTTRWRRIQGSLPSNAREKDRQLILGHVRPEDHGRYICEVNGPNGPASDYIDLHVTGTPTSSQLRIESSQPNVRIGDSFEVRCHLRDSSHTPVTFSWNMPDSRMGPNVQSYNNLLRISNAQVNNNGRYRCTARSPTGVLTEDYHLSIESDEVDSLDHNEIDHQDDDSSIKYWSASRGQNVVLVADSDVPEPVEFKWERQDGPLQSNAHANDRQLVIQNLTARDAGVYLCTISSDHQVPRDHIVSNILIVNNILPYFSQADQSYLILPTLPDAYLKFEIEITFKPEKENGLLLYNSHYRNNSDFVSLGLNNSHVEFRYNMGSGIAKIKSRTQVKLGQWHTVRAIRNQHNGTLWLDHHGPYKGRSGGNFKGLDLKEPLYIGGVPNFSETHRLSGFDRGFVGCISRLVLSNQEQELNAINGVGVTDCEACADVNTCRNGGRCQASATTKGHTCICPPNFHGAQCDLPGQACYPGACGDGRCIPIEPNENNGASFRCLCPFGYSGENCRTQLDIVEPAFSDDGYVAYPSPGQEALNRLKLELKLKPSGKDGLIAYSAQDTQGHGDYLSLALRDGHLEFRFDAGSGSAVIKSAQPLSINTWSSVIAQRHDQIGHLLVNNEPRVSGRSPGQHLGLNLITPLYIGGIDHTSVQIHRDVQLDSGFDGCITEVKLNDRFLDLTARLDAANVGNCGDDTTPSHSIEDENYSENALNHHSNTCENNPCENGGSCFTRYLNFQCICQEGFSGQRCELEERPNMCNKETRCENGGTCIGTPNTYKCMCAKGYRGVNCEKRSEFSTEIRLNGDGYVELPSTLLPHVEIEEESIVVEFTTTFRDGLIFWQGQPPGVGKDFIALTIVDGILEFSFNLGNGPALIRGENIRVDDGTRHRALLKRKERDGSMELDGGEIEISSAPGLLTLLNANGPIYIGGLPDYNLSDGHASIGFTGCLHLLEIQSRPINFKELAVSAVNTSPCSNKIRSLWIPSSLVLKPGHDSSHTTTTRRRNPSSASLISPPWVVRWLVAAVAALLARPLTRL